MLRLKECEKCEKRNKLEQYLAIKSSQHNSQNDHHNSIDDLDASYSEKIRLLVVDCRIETL
jgi:hypothetical protein